MKGLRRPNDLLVIQDCINVMEYVQVFLKLMSKEAAQKEQGKLAQLLETVQSGFRDAIRYVSSDAAAWQQHEGEKFAQKRDEAAKVKNRNDKVLFACTALAWQFVNDPRRIDPSLEAGTGMADYSMIVPVSTDEPQC